MLDQRQKSPRNQLYVTCHVHSRQESAEDKEFGFWTTWDFQAQACLEEELGAYSPRLWETNTKFESSPLLPQNHHHSDLSPKSRRRVILESRTELMQMVQNMPDSCYELSLKDLVIEQQGVQKAGEGTDVEEKSFDFNTQAQIRNQKKKTTYKTRQISRTSSMESETFLIKMFFPTFLGLKKKGKAAGNCSKVSPRPSLEGPENHKDLCVDTRTGSRRRASDDDTLPSCWTFFQSKKGKSKRPRGS